MCVAGASWADEGAQGPQRTMKEAVTHLQEHGLWGKDILAQGTVYVKANCQVAGSLLKTVRVWGDLNCEVGWGSSF